MRPLTGTDGAALLALMHAAAAIDSGRWLMRCPAHRGASASSLEVILEGGRYALSCMCGCSPAAIVAAALALAQAKADGREYKAEPCAA
ncbi:MAG: hypothetical protein KGL33_07295 [Betaproteobacteria bacterium]|nr:hypothetical protein [Betaproteobacteria bacterium]